MKSNLHLKYSSFLVLGTLSIRKNTLTPVDTVTLSEAQVNILNKYIRAGAVDSSAGLLSKADEQIVEEVAPVVTVEEEKVEPVVVVPVVVETPVEAPIVPVEAVSEATQSSVKVESDDEVKAAPVATTTKQRKAAKTEG